MGAAYDQLVAEFVAALKAWQPHVLLQFEVGAALWGKQRRARYRNCCGGGGG
jgi:hypothetical protein